VSRVYHIIASNEQNETQELLPLRKLPQSLPTTIMRIIFGSKFYCKAVV